LDAETTEIEDDSAKNVDVGFACVAAASAHLSQLERTSEKSAQSLIERFCARLDLVANDEIISVTCR
jgi:hypothetical protein